MFANTVIFFRFLDTLLIAGIVFLYVCLLAYVFLKEYSESRYLRRTEQIKRRLWDLFMESPKGLLKTCPVLVKAFDLHQIFDIARYEDERYSQDFGRQIRECMMSSLDMKMIERLAARSRDKWERIEAVIILGYLNTPQGVRILTADLKHKDEDVVYFSILALSHNKTPQVAGLLLKLIAKGTASGQKIVSLLEDFPSSVAVPACAELKNPDAPVRYWSLKLLTRLKFAGAATGAAELTKDSSADVRAAACECLGVLGAKDARGVLLDRLKDDLWFVRMFSVRALGAIFGSEALGLVAELIFDPSWPVKESVEKLMAQHIEKAMPHLERCLVSGDDMTRASCVTAFVDAEYIPKIFDDILSGSSHASQQSRRLLEELIHSHFYFGLKKALDKLEPGPREDILKVVESIDEALAKKIRTL